MSEYLRDPSKPPAIKNAMAQASERKEQGLPVANFASGNVGQLPLNMNFMDIDIKTREELPSELRSLSKAIKRGIQKAFETPKGLPYSPTGGKEGQKKLALEYFSRFHAVSHNDLERIVVTAGGQRAMTAALRSIKPETTVFLSQWEYAPVPSILKNNRCKPVRIKVGEDLRPKIEDLKKKVTKHAVFYLSMPNNPSGFVSPDHLQQIVEIMVDNEGAVIWDAPYLFTILRLTKNGAEFNADLLDEQLDEFKEILDESPRKICLLSSISKTCLAAGLRFGFATGTKTWIANMDNILGREDLSSPTASFIIAQEILKAFLKKPETHKWLGKILARRLSYLLEKNLPVKLPDNNLFGGLYALMSTGKMDGKKFIKKASKKHGIIPIPGRAFYGKPVNAIRLSLVSVPWTKGDPQWKENVESLQGAIEDLL